MSENKHLSKNVEVGGSANAGRAVIISMAAAIGGFLFGFDTAVINGAVEAINKDFDLNSTATGVVVAIALLGCAMGAWFAGSLADRFGRLRMMVVAAVLFFVSSLGSAFAFSALDLGIWRLVGGLGIGIASVIGPTYISEVAPANIRGRLASLQQMAIVMGIFSAFLSDAFFANTAGGAASELWGMPAWRWMLLAEVVPALIYGILALSIPESPRYLVARGKVEKATDVLQNALGDTREQAEQKVKEIQSTINSERKPRLSDLKSSKGGLQPIVWVGIALAAFQQLVGINVIFYYSTSLWQSVGFKEEDSFAITVVTSVINIVVTVIAILLIDRVGRRLLLLVGSVGMAVSLITMGIAFFNAKEVPVMEGGVQLVKEGVPQTTQQLDGAWGPIALVAANLFVVFFGLSWGPVMWVLLGEMFPNSIRAVAMAVATSVNWITNWLVTVTFPTLGQINLGMTYLIYGGFAVLSWIFVYYKVPETKGKELEEMSMDAYQKK